MEQALQRVLTTVDRKPLLSAHNLYFQWVPDWQRDEVTSCLRHLAGLMAGPRHGQMTTRSGPVFAVKIPSESSPTVASCAATKFYAVPILSDRGKDGRHGIS
jgi:hypothetical protein